MGKRTIVSPDGRKRTFVDLEDLKPLSEEEFKRLTNGWPRGKLTPEQRKIVDAFLVRWREAQRK